MKNFLTISWNQKASQAKEKSLFKLIRCYGGAVLAVFFMLQGCVAVSEITSDYDIVLGKNFAPPIHRYSQDIPIQALFIPVFDSKNENIVVDEFEKNLVLLRLIPTGQSFTSAPTKEEVQALASRYKCDVVLFLKVDHTREYPPPFFTIKIVLQRVDNGFVLWEGAINYDGSQRLVANSARRYTQKILNKQVTIDKSLEILRDNTIFARFVGWHVAQSLNTWSTISLTPLKPEKNTAPKTSGLQERKALR